MMIHYQRLCIDLTTGKSKDISTSLKCKVEELGIVTSGLWNEQISVPTLSETSLTFVTVSYRLHLFDQSISFQFE